MSRIIDMIQHMRRGGDLPSLADAGGLSGDTPENIESLRRQQAEDAEMRRDLEALCAALENWHGSLLGEKNAVKDLLAGSQQASRACSAYAFYSGKTLQVYQDNEGTEVRK